MIDDAALKIPGGPVSKLYAASAHRVRAPWQIYPLGILLGLGFNTATEIGLLVLAASSAASEAPWWTMLALPLLFASGMALLDAADGIVIRYAYGWALAQPLRRLRYNLAITFASVVVALAVGTIEVMTLVGERLRLTDAPWMLLGAVDGTALGVSIVA